jgi:hypothetical protein
MNEWWNVLILEQVMVSQLVTNSSLLSWHQMFIIICKTFCHLNASCTTQAKFSISFLLRSLNAPLYFRFYN